MAEKKGIIPAHVKKKKFSHKQVEHPVIQILEEIEDPRKPSQFFKYSLTSVLFMTLIATICGAKDWPQIVIMSQGMTDWLSTYVDMSGGIPCERTFKNLFNAVNPTAIERALQDLAKMIRKKVAGDVISFDGQTERGTADKNANLSGIHLLNAWSSDNEICIGQLKVDDKSNEITAIPKLMECLDLKGTIVTNDGASQCGASFWQSIEKGHGRVETRTCTAISVKDLPSKNEWEELNTIVRICRERKEGSHLHFETMYYITSLKPVAELIADIARRHWGVENKLHWRLDVVFRQDNSRYRDRNGARNMATIRKIALNALVKETSIKKGVATKQCAAACNPAYREKVLKNLF